MPHCDCCVGLAGDNITHSISSPKPVDMLGRGSLTDGSLADATPQQAQTMSATRWLAITAFIQAAAARCVNVMTLECVSAPAPCFTWRLGFGPADVSVS